MDYNNVENIDDDEFLTNYSPKNKAEEHLFKALNLMKAELFQAAMVEFHQACQLNPQEIVPLAKKIYTEKIKLQQYEAALVVGVLLLSLDDTDYILATELAGYARKNNDYMQATSLYRKALTIDPNYMLALCNLGASLEKVPYYDQDAILAYKYFNNTDFIFPEYLVLSEDGKYEFDNGYIDSITSKTIEYLTQKQEEKYNKNLAIASKVGVSKEIGTSVANTWQTKKSFSKRDLTPTNYKQYLDHLSANDHELQDICNYNIILLYLKENVNILALGERVVLLTKKLETTKKELPHFDILAGLYYARIGQSDKAINIFFNVLKKDRFDRYANANLGLICRKVGRMQQSARYLIFAYYLYRRALNSFNINNLIIQARIKFSSRVFRVAKGYFMILIEEGYAEVEDYISCVQCWDFEKNTDKAIEIIQQCIAKFPESESAKITLSDFYDVLLARADTLLLENNRERMAFDLYKKAYILDHRLDLIKKLLVIMRKIKKLSDDEKKFRVHLKTELNNMLSSVPSIGNEIIQNRKENTEDRRIEYLKKAKKLIRENKYLPAVAFLESAFRIKNDQATYSILSNLYKALGNHDDLEKLNKRQPTIINR